MRSKRKKKIEIKKAISDISETEHQMNNMSNMNMSNLQELSYSTIPDAGDLRNSSEQNVTRSIETPQNEAFQSAETIL